MEDSLQILATYEVWIYILLGGVALFYLRKVLLAWREWQGAIFGLEKESGQRHFSQVMVILMLLLMLILAEFIIVTFVLPSMPRMVALVTPTVDILATPTPTLQVAAARAVITPSPGGIPTAATVTAEGCAPGKIEWSFPKSGQELKGIVTLKGTVNLPNLGFYKYEYSPAGSSTWTTIAANNQVKVNAELGGLWNTGQITPGDYRLRLVVADSQNNILPACVVSIRISAP